MELDNVGHRSTVCRNKGAGGKGHMTNDVLSSGPKAQFSHGNPVGWKTDLSEFSANKLVEYSQRKGKTPTIQVSFSFSGCF